MTNYVEPTGFVILNTRINEIESSLKEEIHELETSIKILRAQLDAKPTTTKANLPEGYVNCSEFHRKFMFLSPLTVKNILVEKEEWFKDDVIKDGSRLFFRPKKMIELFEMYGEQYPRLSKQYKNWKKHNKELINLVGKWKRKNAEK